MIPWICALLDHPRKRDRSRVDPLYGRVHTMDIGVVPCCCGTVGYVIRGSYEEIRVVEKEARHG